MRKMYFAFAGLVLLALTTIGFGQNGNAPRYQMPPKEVVDAFDAQPLPAAILSPSKQMMALTYRRAYPTIAELSQPILRLAGARVNPNTNGPQRTANIYAITLKKISDGSETKVTVPPQANLSNIHFSPDGTHLSFLNTRSGGIELWIADTTTGRSKMISGTDRLNATAGDPCDWLRDNKTLVCTMVPAMRGAAPGEPAVPTGPNIQENSGKAAPAATYEDMLKTAHDDDLFEYYFTSQLALIDIATGRKSLSGATGNFRRRYAVTEWRVLPRHADQASLFASDSDERLSGRGRGVVARQSAGPQNRRCAVARRCFDQGCADWSARNSLAPGSAGDGDLGRSAGRR